MTRDWLKRWRRRRTGMNASRFLIVAVRVGCLSLLLALVIAHDARAQNAPNASRRPASSASALADAIAAFERRDYEAVLSKTDPNSDAARTATDPISKARLHALRGAALEYLKRPSESARESVAASDALATANEPRWRVALLFAAGLTLLKAGEPGAEATLARARALGTAMPQDPEIAGVFDDAAHSLSDLNRPDLAIGFARSATDIAQAVRPDSTLLAGALLTLGIVETDAKSFADAESHLNAARQIRERLTPASRQLAAVLQNLGYLKLQQQYPKDAAKYFMNAIDILEKLGGNEEDLERCLRQLGRAQTHMLDFRAARKTLSRDADILLKSFPNSPHFPETLINLGSLENYDRDYAAARTHLTMAASRLEQAEPDSPLLATAYEELGNLALEQGDLVEAQHKFERELAILLKSPGKTEHTAEVLAALGGVEHDRGEFASSAQHLQDALQIQERSSSDPIAVRRTLYALALTKHDSGEYEAARQLVMRAQEIERKLGLAAADRVEGLNWLALIAFDEGNFPLAGDYYRQALGIENSLAEATDQKAETLNGLGLIALSTTSNMAAQQGDPRDLDEAESDFRNALSILERLRPSSPNILLFHQNLGVVLGRKGKFAEAERELRRVLSAVDGHADDYGQNFPILLLNLATFVAAQDKDTLNPDKQRHKEVMGYLKLAREFQARRAPSSLETARILDAEAYFDEDLVEREALRRQAFEVARNQAATIAGDEARQRFASLLEFYTLELVRTQIARGKWGDAFATSEEGRALALQQLFAGHRVTSDMQSTDAAKKYRTLLEQQIRADAALRLAEDRLEDLRRDFGRGRQHARSERSRRSGRQGADRLPQRKTGCGGAMGAARSQDFASICASHRSGRGRTRTSPGYCLPFVFLGSARSHLLSRLSRQGWPRPRRPRRRHQHG